MLCRMLLSPFSYGIITLYGKVGFMSYLIILIVFWLGRLLLNISRFHRTSLLKAIYEDYACGKNNKAVQHRNEIISLFKYADIQQEIIVDHTTMGHKIINSTPYPICSIDTLIWKKKPLCILITP